MRCICCINVLDSLDISGLDEAHNIVLPYSWGQPTTQAGPPVSDSPASQESSYCHALVHRKEGEYDGELGLTGWNNSCFWFRTTGQHRQGCNALRDIQTSKVFFLILEVTHV